MHNKRHYFRFALINHLSPIISMKPYLMAVIDRFDCRSVMELEIRGQAFLYKALTSLPNPLFWTRIRLEMILLKKQLY